MEDRLRILFTIECYPPVITGSGMAAKSIAAALARKGHQVAVICPGKGLQTEQNVEEGVRVYRLRSLPVLVYKEYSFSPFGQKSISNIFNQFRPHIVNLQDHFFISSKACSEAKKRGIVVLGTNQFHPGNILPQSGLKKDTLIYRTLEKKFWDSFVKVFNSLQAVTVPTKTAAEIIRKAGVNRPAIHVISNIIRQDIGDPDTGIRDKDDEDIRAKYGIGKNDKVLISVSRLDKEKRVDVLIKALSLIREEADFKCIVAGKGKEMPLLKRIARESLVSDKVIFTGPISDKHLRSLYRISDIFLTASEVELQGLSIMEAMANGLPVIAANSMAIPELVHEGINGFLFEPGNYRQARQKILFLLKDGALRKKMGSKSLELIKKHQSGHCIDKFEELYYSLLAQFSYRKAE